MLDIMDVITTVNNIRFRCGNLKIRGTKIYSDIPRTFFCIDHFCYCFSNNCGSWYCCSNSYSSCITYWVHLSAVNKRIFHQCGTIRAPIRNLRCSCCTRCVCKFARTNGFICRNCILWIQSIKRGCCGFVAAFS